MSDLGNEVFGPDDRAGYQLREEREIEQVIGPVVQGFELSPADVDRIAHRLEYEERNTDRQEDVLEVEEPLSEEVVGDFDQEIRIFEIAQHAQIDQYAQSHEPVFRPLRPHFVDGMGDPVVAH